MAFGHIGHINLIPRIHIPEPPRHHKREMRRDKPHIDTPGLFLASGIFDIRKRSLFNLIINLYLSRCTRPRLCNTIPGVFRLNNPRIPIALAARNAVFCPQFRMQVARELCAKTVQLIETTKVLLARYHNIVTDISQAMRPRNRIRRHGKTIVIRTDAIDITPRHK